MKAKPNYRPLIALTRFSALPILKRAMVDAGRARMTDLETTIWAPADGCSPGLHQPAPNALYPTNDHDPDDFPAPPDPIAVAGRVTIPAAILKRVLAAAPKKDPRRNLLGVHVTRTHIEAADGKVAARVSLPNPTGPGDPTFTLPYDIAGLILSTRAPHPTVAWEPPITAGTKNRTQAQRLQIDAHPFTIQTRALATTSDEDSGPHPLPNPVFPDMRCIRPNPACARRCAAVDAQALRDAALQILAVLPKTSRWTPHTHECLQFTMSRDRLILFAHTESGARPRVEVQARHVEPPVDPEDYTVLMPTAENGAISMLRPEVAREALATLPREGEVVLCFTKRKAPILICFQEDPR